MPPMWSDSVPTHKSTCGEILLRSTSAMDYALENKIKP